MWHAISIYRSSIFLSSCLSMSALGSAWLWWRNGRGETSVEPQSNHRWGIPPPRMSRCLKPKMKATPRQKL
ncbi:hypothetical protein EDB89DRAFT_1952852 [Lactarius sanguifluus]|nr:hypothetical protein EDB89DRAFT_1952852 [Lactarius sanguifluus]